ncbi:MAG TPA: hypothetical protein VK741_29270 [Acetobacteraceae bacterium]|jgi:hypothetical protein|nr:hypothetical protein [Acetobacteraceae bacterium]
MRPNQPTMPVVLPIMPRPMPLAVLPAIPRPMLAAVPVGQA